MVRYLHPADHHPVRIRKVSKIFSRELDFKDIKFPVKIRGIHKIEKNCIGISIFGYENKEKYLIYVSKKCCEEEHVHLLLIEKEDKGNYVLIKDFNTSMYDYLLHRERKYCLQAFIKAEILKCHINDCFKINGKR